MTSLLGPLAANQLADFSAEAIKIEHPRGIWCMMQLVRHPEVIDEPWFASGAERAKHIEELGAMADGGRLSLRHPARAGKTPNMLA